MSVPPRIDGRPSARVSLVVVALFVACSCGPDPMSRDDAGVEPIYVFFPRFDLTADPLDFGAIPFPDDLYLDDAGRVSLGALPGEESASSRELRAAMRESLRELTGFSTVAPIYFYFPPGSLDPTSLPSSPSESVREDSSVFLLDVDPASPTAFRRREPVLVHWHADLGQLALRPHDGHPLVPGRRYAAVVTTAVRDRNGVPIGPAPRFAAIRDAASRPDDPLEAEAYDHYTSVLASLASNGTPRRRVAGLAVFTVQSVTRDMRDARAIVWRGEPPRVELDAAIRAGEALDALLGAPEMPEALGNDVPGGVAHRHIAWLVQGHFRSPGLMAARRHAHGRFTRDDAGQLEVKRYDDVPFTLTLPSGELARVPVLVFQHALGAERSDLLGIADALAAEGWAAIAIDLPFHGMRASGDSLDARHRFGPGEGPDGFGDRAGEEIQLEFLGALDEYGELVPLHPFYVRDAFRQSAVDLMTLVRVLREGDWSSVREVPGLEALDFTSERIAFLGMSLGGMVGTIFVASEPEIGAAILAVTGGDLSRLVEASATFSSFLVSSLFVRIGAQPTALTQYPPSFRPELAIFQTLLDAGDAISFAPLLASGGADLLFQMAEHDEFVPNRATEALARAAGAAIVDADPVHTDLARASAPVVGNVEHSSGRRTRGVYRFAPATHGLLSIRSDAHRFAHPPVPPFRPIDPIALENPIDAAVGQIVHFLGSWRSGAAELSAPDP